MSIYGKAYLSKERLLASSSPGQLASPTNDEGPSHTVGRPFEKAIYAVCAYRRRPRRSINDR